MQTYLVGGAVRDSLLNYSFTDKDWVVVGATPEQMLDQGFEPVGKDFPVFLHPQTKEEYALARTERKQGHGYKGFTVYAAPDVTLEQDLIRRDLTINAMAQDDDGNIVDPYNGQQDLANKILRHVSDAFIEDPLRVLRVARFAARYAHLGFTVADETLELMESITNSGELNHLVGERVWQETHKALAEQTPEQYFQTLQDTGALAAVMPELDQLFGVPQPPKHHPEIDCGIHSLMVLQQASLLSSSTAVRFASLMHDLGKGTTPQEEWPRHIAHEHRGLKLIEQLCQKNKVPNEHRDLAKLACQHHTNIHRAFELKAETVLKVLESCDAIRRPERFEELLLCCEADAKGRTGFEQTDYPQVNYFRQAQNSICSVLPQQFLEQGIKGKALGEAIRQERLNQLRHLKQQS